MNKIHVRLTDGRVLVFEDQSPDAIIRALRDAGVTSTDQIVETIAFVPARVLPREPDR